jgi:hypothetical protein
MNDECMSADQLSRRRFEIGGRPAIGIIATSRGG